MTIRIGKGVTVAEDMRSGAVGQNYLTGSVTVNADAWSDGGVIRGYAWLGNAAETAAYDMSANTGTVTVNVAQGVNARVAKVYDFDGDGTFRLADALPLLRHYCNGTDAETAAAYFPWYCDTADVQSEDVIRVLKAYVQSK